MNEDTYVAHNGGNGDDSREIFECKNLSSRTSVRILHLRACDGSQFGARGPCCRCNAAMKFFFELRRLLKSSSLPGIQRGKILHQPDWFIFADDDYFLRMHYIEAVLSNYPAKKAYAIKLWTNGDVPIKRSIGNTSPHESEDYEQGREGMGMFIYNSNCTQPCAHRMHWMGFGGFSVGAMYDLQAQIHANAVVKVCERLSLTHDVGLGMFTWMNSLNAIRFIEHLDVIKNIHHIPPTQASLFEAALTHNHEHRSYSELFHRTLLKTHPEGSTMTLDIEKYIQNEIELGMLTTKVFLPYHYRGFKNTVFYRKQQVLEAMLDGILVNSSSLKTINALPRKIENTDYLFSDCNEDTQVFNEWLDTLNTTVEEFASEPQMCLLYTQHVSNLLVFNETVMNAMLNMQNELL